MLVVAATPLYPPRSRVGAWLATHEFLAGLARRGHTVRVHTYVTRTEPDYRIGGVHVTSNLFHPDADLVISHAGDNQQAHQAAVAAGVPSVRMVHGAFDDDALDGAALAVFNSHATAGGRPGVVCHPPTFPERYQTTPGEEITLVNLSREKGGELFKVMTTAHRHRRFLGVRGGYGRQHVGPGKNLDVIASTENMRDDVYRRTRILCVPSELETWGMVAVEAMCSGIPVIAHPTEGLQESLGAAGIYADRSDLSAWLDHLDRLDDPGEYETASLAAKTRAAELDPQQSIDRFCDAVEALA